MCEKKFFRIFGLKYFFKDIGSNGRVGYILKVANRIKKDSIVHHRLQSKKSRKKFALKEQMIESSLQHGALAKIRTEVSLEHQTREQSKVRLTRSFDAFVQIKSVTSPSEKRMKMFKHGEIETAHLSRPISIARCSHMLTLAKTVKNSYCCQFRFN